MSFSQDIQSHIKENDDLSDLSLQEREEITEGRKFAREIFSEVLRSRETLGEVQSKVIESMVRSNPDLIADCLDEFFTREVIKAVPAYVLRTLQWSQMEATLTPSTATNTYIREATRTYILGFPQASIALCRAALEQGLKERLGRQPSGGFIKFQDLLKEARRWHLLDGVTEKIARAVANAADDVLHEKPADISEARDVLDQLRGVLQHIYSTEGHC